MFGTCAGGDQLRTPTLTIKHCPSCGGEIELFSTDSSAKCEQCGFEIYNDVQTCIQWCRYARLCFGEERYQQMLSASRK